MSREGKKNAYLCDTCLQYVITIDRDDGVTPMFLACRVLGEPSDKGNTCRGTMTSMMYPDEPWPERDPGGREIPTEPSWEWFSPRGAELKRLHRKARHGDLLAKDVLNHIEKGGLVIRKIS